MCWWLLLLLVMLENFLLCTLKSGFLTFVSRVFSSLPYPSLFFWLLCAAFLHRWHRCSLTPTIAILWVWKSIWNVCLSSGTLIGLCFQNSPKRHIYALSEIIINMFCASFTCQAYFGWEASMNAIEMKCHSVERNASAPTRTHTHTQNIYRKVFNKEKCTFSTNFFRFSIFMLWLSKTWVSHWYSWILFCHTIGHMRCAQFKNPSPCQPWSFIRSVLMQTKTQWLK